MNLVLIGYRCTGKTTIGQILAEKLGWQLLDTDTLVQERSGKSIAQIVAEGGWPAFRQIEAEVVRDVCLGGDRRIISFGGGTILPEANLGAAKSCGKIILLRATADTIWARIQADQKTAAERPALTDKKGQAEIEHLLAERRQPYEAAADFAISTDTMEPNEIAGRILAWLKIHRFI